MSSISALNALLGSSNSSSTINLTEILQAALGASSPGIDVNSAVNAAVSAASAPEQTWESQLSTLQSQASALNQLQTNVTSLDNDMQSLNSVTGPLSARTVTSSNSSIVSASAASGTTTGNHVVQVSNLATTASWTSGTFASGSTTLPAGSFTITTAGGSPTTITTDGTQTLSDVASQINSDKLGLTASVITDASGSRLAIVANTSGSAANFTISPSGSTGFGFTQAVTGINASITIDGIAVSSASNTVTGIIPGLTLNLLSADPGLYVSLGVGPDTAQAAAAVNQFVSDYNTVIQAINAQFAVTGSSEGVLATDPNLRNLQSDLEGVMSYVNKPSSGTTSVSNLSSLGITVNSNGTLSVNSATLNNALSNNFSDVQTFFQGSALNGFANTLDQQLTNFISPSDGAFTIDLQSISSQESQLQTDITNFQQNVITPLQKQLQSQYSQAEILLQQLPTQMKQINQELGFNSSN
ncbi:MAG TPA: flagellar filament capping protein FliD [Terracidiphilus sp.]|nr:flagellar filament capping protein FliD [Terracidiphilus sp.]